MVAAASRMALLQGLVPDESSDVRRLPIERLRLGPRVRLGPVDAEHLDVLVQLGGRWGPLLVTPEGRIVDGNYRYLAARRLGLRYLECTTFVGSDAAVFVEAVARNCAHGLPLTLDERRAAVGRILREHPDWSDRRVGALCGLAHDTVGRVRRRLSAGGEIRHLDRRQGRDGRYQSTARGDVERRPDLGAPEDRLRSVPLGDPPPSAAPEPEPEPSADRAFTSTDPGRSFATWFERSAITDEWTEHVGAVPLSRLYAIADEARRRAAAWEEFATALSGRVHERTQSRR